MTQNGRDALSKRLRSSIFMSSPDGLIGYDCRPPPCQSGFKSQSGHNCLLLSVAWLRGVMGAHMIEDLGEAVQFRPWPLSFGFFCIPAVSESVYFCVSTNVLKSYSSQVGLKRCSVLLRTSVAQNYHATQTNTVISQDGTALPPHPRVSTVRVVALCPQ